ncbi:hypothetical protein [Arthrobacter zhaoguopingii]|uniref:hypothetical protein n=1 Tax=Arthrobacter zhaoguopingii TaxID=2681491 RepID=UPI00191623A1|nr:hypothetical protein [Arthrobacter zhaoguopingii]
MIAASIGGGGVEVSISEAVPGLDHNLLELVLAAVAHAGGSHEQLGLRENPDGTLTRTRHTSLFPWPKDKA